MIADGLEVPENHFAGRAIVAGVREPAQLGNLAVAQS